MNNKLKAFTLAETLIVLVLIGFIASLTVANSMRSDKIDEKKISIVSMKFYSSAEAVYQQILFKHTKNNNILNLQVQDKSFSEALRDLFVKYNDGEAISCPSISEDYKENTYCARFQSDVFAGFNLNGDCKKSIDTVYEYAQKEKGSATNSCGYIIYGIKKLNGTMGKDLFIIPLGKAGFKRISI